MSTYVISDIHGHYTEFIKMLEKIRFSGNDELWVLGDLLDRGNESLDMLRFAVYVSEKYDNIHFLKGNHEYMMEECLSADESSFHIGYNDWGINGGHATLRQINDAIGSREWIQHALAPWLKSLPYFSKITVGDTEYMLVHAGFDPNKFGFDASLNWGQNEIYVGSGFGAQSPMDMVWIRQEWMFSKVDAPIMTIHGHTMTMKFADALDDIADAIGAQCSMPFGGIFYYRNKIDIDCGAGMNNQLGCLRLDDMREFYIQIR